MATYVILIPFPSSKSAVFTCSQVLHINLAKSNRNLIKKQILQNETKNISILDFFLHFIENSNELLFCFDFPGTRQGEVQAIRTKYPSKIPVSA